MPCTLPLSINTDSETHTKKAPFVSNNQVTPRGVTWMLPSVTGGSTVCSVFSQSKSGRNHKDQGQLEIWTEHSTLIFENLKPVDKSKNNFSAI